ncbi:MAG: hypothetical protein KDD42_01830 [Bdellovibrionales bacterium]|nr:hypothetical protein [Bdellovibrionales bacterium]
MMAIDPKRWRTPPQRPEKPAADRVVMCETESAESSSMNEKSLVEALNSVFKTSGENLKALEEAGDLGRPEVAKGIIGYLDKCDSTTCLAVLYGLTRSGGKKFEGGDDLVALYEKHNNNKEGKISERICFAIADLMDRATPQGIEPWIKNKVKNSELGSKEPYGLLIRTFGHLASQGRISREEALPELERLFDQFPVAVAEALGRAKVGGIEGLKLILEKARKGILDNQGDVEAPALLVDDFIKSVNAILRQKTIQAEARAVIRKFLDDNEADVFSPSRGLFRKFYRELKKTCAKPSN